MKPAARHSTPIVPQFYQPRVEVALLALADALVGCQMLVRFMAAQQGPDWRDMSNLLDAAESDFLKAQKWLRKRRRKGGKNA